MGGSGTPAACWSFKTRVWRADWCAGGPPLTLPPMGVFLWTLEFGGLTIALVGMGRERWLASRRR